MSEKHSDGSNLISLHQYSIHHLLLPAETQMKAVHFKHILPTFLSEDSHARSQILTIKILLYTKGGINYVYLGGDSWGTFCIS